MEYWSTGVMKRLEYWSVGVLKRLINMRVLFAFSTTPALHSFHDSIFLLLLHRSITPTLHCLITPPLQYSILLLLLQYSNV